MDPHSHMNHDSQENERDKSRKVECHEEVQVLRKVCEAAHSGNVASIIELLDKHPLLLHGIDNCGSESPLHLAAMLGHTDFARVILSQNRELALELDRKGRLPLHLASAKGHVEIVKLLLELGGKRTCTLRDDMGRTPLHVAAMKGRNKVIIQLLCANLESIGILTHQGETILHLAVKYKRLDTLKLLLGHFEVFEHLNSKDIDGNTILHLAMADKQTETIKYLVGGNIAGLDINERNENGFTPLDVSLAVQSRSDIRDVEICKLLGESKCTRGLVGADTTTMDTNNNNIINRKEKGDWVYDVRSGLMVVASLIATEAFQAGLTPAGGLSQNGRSLMGSLDKQRYRQYLVCNTISFISSLSIILLLISGFPLRKRLFVWTLMVIMWIACASMALTYSASILFEVPDLTSFEDNLSTYTFIGIGFLVGIVLLGNCLRLVMWLVRGPASRGRGRFIMKLCACS